MTALYIVYISGEVHTQDNTNAAFKRLHYRPRRICDHRSLGIAQIGFCYPPRKIVLACFSTDIVGQSQFITIHTIYCVVFRCIRKWLGVSNRLLIETIPLGQKHETYLYR